MIRLQNSPYFCVLKYARAIKHKVWNEAENREPDWGETLKYGLSVLHTLYSFKLPFSPSHGQFPFLSPNTPYGCVRLARFARVRLLRHALPISLLILRKKNRLFCSLLMKTPSTYNCITCIIRWYIACIINETKLWLWSSAKQHQNPCS